MSSQIFLCYTVSMEPTTTNILLIILGSVSGLLILIIILLGIKMWRLLNTIHRITSVFADEADHIKSVLKYVRKKVEHTIHDAMK